MGLFSGMQFGVDPPGDIGHQNQHTQFSVVMDARYQREDGEPLPWMASLRLRAGPSYPGEARAVLSITEFTSAYGAVAPIVHVEDLTLSGHPLGLY